MINFNSDTHTYTDGGKVIPSVTQILSGVGLVDFEYVPRQILELASLRGKIVHTIIEYYECGVLDHSSIDPDLMPYFDAYLKANMPKPEASEKLVFSKQYQYAGTLDQQFPGWINDIKTGITSPVHGLQLTAYWLAEHAINDKPGKLTALYLHDNGTFELKQYPFEPLAWLAVLAEYRWRQKNNMIKENKR